MKSILTFGFLALAVGVSAQSSNGEYHLDKEYAINPRGTLSLKVNDAKVSVTGTDRSTAHIKVDRIVTTKGWVIGKDDFSVIIKEEDGNLSLRENSTSVGVVGYYSEKYKIEIELPTGASLNIDGNDGNIEVKSVNGAIEIESDDADILLTQCGGKKFKFRINDGGIKMDQGQGELQLRADDATVKIQNARFTSVNATINDGGFYIESSLTDNGDYQIQTDDGSVAFTILEGGGKFDIHHNDGHVSADDSFSFVEKSENHSSLTLAKGTASVNIRTNDGNVKLVKR